MNQVGGGFENHVFVVESPAKIATLSESYQFKSLCFVNLVFEFVKEGKVYAIL